MNDLCNLLERDDPLSGLPPKGHLHQAQQTHLGPILTS